VKTSVRMRELIVCSLDPVLVQVHERNLDVGPAVRFPSMNVGRDSRRYLNRSAGRMQGKYSDLGRRLRRSRFSSSAGGSRGEDGSSLGQLYEVGDLLELRRPRRAIPAMSERMVPGSGTVRMSALPACPLTRRHGPAWGFGVMPGSVACSGLHHPGCPGFRSSEWASRPSPNRRFGDTRRFLSSSLKQPGAA